MCRGKGTFRRYVVTLVGVLGLYLVCSALLKSNSNRIIYHQPSSGKYQSSLRPVGPEPADLPPRPTQSDRSPSEEGDQPVINNTAQPSSLRVDNKVLLLYDEGSSAVAKAVQTVLLAQRTPHDVYLHGDTSKLQLVATELSGGEHEITGKYSLIICADVTFLYGKWPESFVEHYLDYSRRFNVNIIHFASPAHSTLTTHFTPVNITASNVIGVSLNSSRKYYYLRSGEWFTDILLNDSWTGFIPADSALFHGGLEVLSYIKYRHGSPAYEQTTPLSFISTRRDVREVLIGSPINFWMTKLLLLEVMRLYSPHQRFGRQRWVMIDIDDIFVAPTGLKMTKEDVQALLKSQEVLRQYVPGLTFNLGFCGFYYDKGLESEVNGSRYLVANQQHFWWFGHIFNHYQPHTVAEKALRSYMSSNLEFAKHHSIASLENSYSVSPHHSGVYPVHLPLYKAWAELLNVTMTTTEEYPHLYPSHMRRGFIFNGIMVVPRQTCRLFTHNYLFEDFEVVGKGGGVASRGREGLKSVAEGGEIFDTLLYNPISIFMTHVTNYAKDRLAPFLFEHLFKFVTRWTKLELLAGRPLTLGQMYFSLFPEDKVPLWTSPCSDKRHMEIWAQGKNCSRLPEAVILGPQKTGSTALQTFMITHPNMTSSFQSKEKFEEVQFFSDERLYMKGIDWYMEQFPSPHELMQVNFEKSATYFTHPKCPERIYSLLPKVKLIIILQDPVKRAYSWYQHVRAHDDPVAMKYSFLEVLTASLNHTPSTSEENKLNQLRLHCLEPGRYHKYISKWLKLFPSSKVLFVDGGMLDMHPSRVMAAVQKFLRVPNIDYGQILSYSSRKGHYCLLVEGKQKCLGPGKGRLYSPLQNAELSYLEEYYAQENLKLAALLRNLKRPLPMWLST